MDHNLDLNDEDIFNLLDFSEPPCLPLPPLPITYPQKELNLYEMDIFPPPPLPPPPPPPPPPSPSPSLQLYSSLPFPELNLYQQEQLQLPAQPAPDHEALAELHQQSTVVQPALSQPLNVENYDHDMIEKIRDLVLSNDTMPSNEAYYNFVREHLLDTAEEETPGGEGGPPALIPCEPGQLDCDHCLKFGEIVHSRGSVIVAVAIHGRVGSFSHAVYDAQEFCDDGQRITQHFFMDFSGQDNLWVKVFLKIYVMFLNSLKANILRNTISSFYETLTSEDLDVHEAGPSGAASSPPPLEFSADMDELLIVDENGAPTMKQTLLAAQRQKTKKLKLEDLAPLFHLTLQDAAKALGFSTAVIKHKCREFGVKRWPGRKIRSIDKQLEDLEKKLSKRGTGAMLTIREEMEKLHYQRARILAGLESSSVE